MTVAVSLTRGGFPAMGLPFRTNHTPTRSPAMALRLLGSLGTLGVLIGAAALMPHPAASQQQAAPPPLGITAFGDKAAPAYVTRRTSWGDPDLQGVWSSDDNAGI